MVGGCEGEERIGKGEALARLRSLTEGMTLMFVGVISTSMNLLKMVSFLSRTCQYSRLWVTLIGIFGFIIA